MQQKVRIKAPTTALLPIITLFTRTVKRKKCTWVPYTLLLPTAMTLFKTTVTLKLGFELTSNAT